MNKNEKIIILIMAMTFNIIYGLEVAKVSDMDLGVLIKDNKSVTIPYSRGIHIYIKGEPFKKIGFSIIENRDMKKLQVLKWLPEKEVITLSSNGTAIIRIGGVIKPLENAENSVTQNINIRVFYLEEGEGKF